MRLLLDTHLLLWSVGEPEKLPSAAVPLLEDTNNDLLFSSISLFEIAVKARLGRQDFQVDPYTIYNTLIDDGYIELPLTSRHSLNVLSLPMTHKDPFDRLLVAQAITEGITLLTVDATVAKYPGPIRKF